MEVQAWEKVVQGISESQISAKFDFHARALPLLVSNDKRINLRFATCFGAGVVAGFKSPASANANANANFNTRAKFGAQYPYTIGLSLDSINRLLKKEFLRGRATFLNICINKDAQDTCSDQALFASTKEFLLTAEPFLKIDTSTGELYLDVNKVIRQGTFPHSDIFGHLPLVGDKAFVGRVYFAFTSDENGNFKARIKRTQGGLTIDAESPLAFFTSAIESLTFFIQDQIIQSLTENLAIGGSSSVKRFIDFQFRDYSADANAGEVFFSGELRALHIGGR